MQINSKLNTGYYMPKAGNPPKKETNMENTEEVKDYAKVLGEKKEELWNKIISGDTEPAYQIGGQAFSEKEWERLLRRIDEEVETDKEEGTEEVQEEKKSGREEIMEMMMSGARQVL